MAYVNVNTQYSFARRRREILTNSSPARRPTGRLQGSTRFGDEEAQSRSLQEEKIAEYVLN